MVRDTSIDAYHKLKQDGKRIPQWMCVIHTLRRGEGLTRGEIAQLSGMRLSSVCGRVNELIQENVLADGARRKCQITDESAHVVKLQERTEQRELF